MRAAPLPTLSHSLFGSELRDDVNDCAYAMSNTPISNINPMLID